MYKSGKIGMVVLSVFLTLLTLFTRPVALSQTPGEAVIIDLEIAKGSMTGRNDVRIYMRENSDPPIPEPLSI